MSGSHSSYGSGGYLEQIKPLQLYNNKNVINSLDVVLNTITLPNTQIIFAKPVPNNNFNCPGNIPAITDIGIFTKDLKNFPLNNLPSGGPCVNNMRISPSEMAYVFILLNDYPGAGTVEIKWVNRDTGEVLGDVTWNFPSCAGNCSWTHWYEWTWYYIGHFDASAIGHNEIDRPGNYACYIYTTWGQVTIFFTVVDTTPPPPLTLSNLTVNDIGSGYISVNVNTSGAGSLTWLIDGVVKQTDSITVDMVSDGTQFNVGVGTHTIQASASNTLTASITILPSCTQPIVNFTIS